MTELSARDRAVDARIEAAVRADERSKAQPDSGLRAALERIDSLTRFMSDPYSRDIGVIVRAALGADERAKAQGDSALRAALEKALQLIDYGDFYWAERFEAQVRVALKTGLAGAPYEPSVEKVERAAAAIHDVMWADQGGNAWRPWVDAHPEDRETCLAYARVALKAAASPAAPPPP